MNPPKIIYITLIILMAACHFVAQPLHGDDIVNCDFYNAHWTVLRRIKINRFESLEKVNEKVNSAKLNLSDIAKFEASFVQVNLGNEPIKLADNVSNWLFETAKVGNSKNGNNFLPASNDRWGIIRLSSATSLAYYIIRIIPNLPSPTFVIELVKARHCGGGMYQIGDDESIIRLEVEESFAKMLKGDS